MKTAWCQQWEESERGWGVRPDGYSLHPSREAAERFLQKFAADRAKESRENGGQVPDEYTRPSGEMYECFVSDKIHAVLVASEHNGVYDCTLLTKGLVADKKYPIPKSKTEGRPDTNYLGQEEPPAPAALPQPVVGASQEPMNDYLKTLKLALTPEDVPTTAHFAILVFDKESAGDGYEPNHSHLYYVFTDKTLWEAALIGFALDKEYYRKPFVGLIVSGKAKVITRIEIK
jgi:hypothetical protein